MWECETCGGEVHEMGGLGNKLWGRCRQCGAQSCVDLSDKNQYTDEEQRQIDDLIQGAAEAEDFFTLDELEEYADEQRAMEARL